MIIKIHVIKYILGKILGNHDYHFYFFTGYYMLVEGATGTFLSRARMETPVLGATGPSCQLQFYYHMFGLGAGTTICLLVIFVGIFSSPEPLGPQGELIGWP